jgi:hypothetical protein
MVGLLQDYLDYEGSSQLGDSSSMGKSVALDIAKMMPQSLREGATSFKYLTFYNLT